MDINPFEVIGWLASAFVKAGAVAEGINAFKEMTGETGNRYSVGNDDTQYSAPESDYDHHDQSFLDNNSASVNLKQSPPVMDPTNINKVLPTSPAPVKAAPIKPEGRFANLFDNFGEARPPQMDLTQADAAKTKLEGFGRVKDAAAQDFPVQSPETRKNNDNDGLRMEDISLKDMNAELSGKIPDRTMNDIAAEQGIRVEAKAPPNEPAAVDNSPTNADSRKQAMDAVDARMAKGMNEDNILKVNEKRFAAMFNKPEVDNSPTNADLRKQALDAADARFKSELALPTNADLRKQALDAADARLRSELAAAPPQPPQVGGSKLDDKTPPAKDDAEMGGSPIKVMNSDKNIDLIINALNKYSGDSGWSKGADSTPDSTSFSHTSGTNFQVQGDTMVSKDDNVKTFEAMLVSFQAVNGKDRMPTLTPVPDTPEIRAKWDDAAKNTGIKFNMEQKPGSKLERAPVPEPATTPKAEANQDNTVRAGNR